MTKIGKHFGLWLLLGIALFIFYALFENAALHAPTPPTKLTYSVFLDDVTKGQVHEVTIQDDQVTGTLADGHNFVSVTPRDPSLADRLIAKGVQVQVAQPDNGPSVLGIIVSWLPMLLLIGFWIFSMRQMPGGAGGNRFMNFGKSRARQESVNEHRVTFADVAGIDEAKQELEEIVDYLKDPQKFQRLGGKIPKGVLLVGPPGTGKTLLARAIAGEAKVPFFTISGSDFVEMFVGVGASRVRDMFEQGKKNAPCIIFIDELDAVGRHRGAGLGGGNDEREQTLNQLLVEMDGFESNEGVILLAATNRPDVLDPALLRPGRFDRQVVVPNPDIVGREQILKVHMRKVPLATDVDPRVIARGTPGFSGADLANLVNEAALLAARKGRRSVTMAEFEEAKDKVLLGAERRSMAMSEDEKKLTAYHEGGHALVMIYAEGHAPVHKVSIVPHGRALGVTMSLPETDKYSQSRLELEATIAALFGGRVAEELIFGAKKVTTGASDDIRRATELARRMVTEFGFSEKLGPLRYSENEEEVFLGRSVTQHKNVSDATARTIDEEIRSIVEAGEATATKILTDHMSELHLLAKALEEFETLSGDEIHRIIRGEKLVRDAGVPLAPTTPAPATQTPAKAGPKAVGGFEPECL
ncbi:MAG TPA: ATP-dependent zinc metalloprotease FtsH [Stellaceae bacterium]|jgi:cell division protease FtsH|nr:ATP-dependent zinc metalloprotease FtsH [Stellaceae bacterium]